MKILLVCLGNICRSPLAEGILQHKATQAHLNWVIDSAGTNGYHTGEPPHHLSQKVAKLNGVDISKQVSRRFVKEDINRYDLILAMADDVMKDIKSICKDQFDTSKVKLFLNEHKPGENRDVPDPWYGDEDGYHNVYRIIEEACETIINKYQ
jgi:protein-tyrosine phosphatase